MNNIFPSFYQIPKKDLFAFFKQVKSKKNMLILSKSVEFIELNYIYDITDKKTFYKYIYGDDSFNENKLRQLIYRINKEFDNYLLRLNTKPLDKEFNLFIKQHQIGIFQNKRKTLKKISKNKKENDGR